MFVLELIARFRGFLSFESRPNSCRFNRDVEGRPTVVLLATCL